MTRSTKQTIIAVIVSPLLVIAIVALFTNILNAASKDELYLVKTECIKYTEDVMKIHENLDEIRYNKIIETLAGLNGRVEFLYLRELEKMDRDLYLKELEKIEDRRSSEKLRNFIK